MEKETAMTDNDDRNGQTCTMCCAGYYTETSIHDDWDGVLHCTNKKCNHEVKRYKGEDDPKPQPEPVKSKLSPAAQAVSNAAKSSLDWEAGYLPNAVAAAALRAAADQVVPETNLPIYASPYEEGIQEARQDVREGLLAIAAELEAQ
jgi:hypothetical protein